MSISPKVFLWVMVSVFAFASKHCDMEMVKKKAILKPCHFSPLAGDDHFIHVTCEFGHKVHFPHFWQHKFGQIAMTKDSSALLHGFKLMFVDGLKAKSFKWWVPRHLILVTAIHCDRNGFNCPHLEIQKVEEHNVCEFPFLRMMKDSLISLCVKKSKQWIPTMVPLMLLNCGMENGSEMSLKTKNGTNQTMSCCQPFWMVTRLAPTVVTGAPLNHLSCQLPISIRMTGRLKRHGGIWDLCHLTKTLEFMAVRVFNSITIVCWSCLNVSETIQVVDVWIDDRFQQVKVCFPTMMAMGDQLSQDTLYAKMKINNQEESG